MINLAASKVGRKRREHLFYRVNWQIRAEKVRLIDEEGKQLGVFPISKAREIAQKAGLDLVEIAPRANPVVVKLVDYHKFKYQQEKKKREERKKEKGGVKEIRITPFIAEGDLEIRVKRAKKFLKEGKRLKLVVRFIGRQIANKQFGYQAIENFKERIKEEGEQEGEPKLTGKRLISFFKPKR